MRNIKKLSLCVLMLALVSTAAVADIHYVNPGESIHTAIVAADPGDEIEVAPGTYTEAIGFTGKAVRLYSSGGPYVTTIDGTGHNHVVQCVNSEGPGTILEGFTITGGNARGSTWDQYGGGMYNYNSSPTVTNCILTGNSARLGGGGMHNWYNSSPTVTNCTFSGNNATQYEVGDGGGMFNYYNSSPTVTNCTFIGNTAHYGGGMHNYDNSSPTVIDCTFTDNTAYTSGGGMYNYDNSPTLTNCTFTDNTASLYGGGMCNHANSSPTVTNCTFSGNTAKYGGGMRNWYNSSPAVTNCTFTGNTANYGGGMDNASVSPTVTNCIFSGNTANQRGGGMCNAGSSSTVTNCILWADSPDEIFDHDSSTTTTYSDVQGGTGQFWFGEGCIDTDPMFADAEGRLSLGSPCIDAGNDAAVPPGVTTDLDGNPRIQGVCVDMGAYEFQEPLPEPHLSGWVFMPPDAPDFGYSLNEADLVYFYSFDYVQSFNTATPGWSIHMPVGWIYVDWPFYYESDPDILWFALPPESGLWVYHFSTSQWEVLPRIIP